MFRVSLGRLMNQKSGPLWVLAHSPHQNNQPEEQEL